MWWRSLATGESGGSEGWVTLRRREQRWKCVPNGARIWTRDQRKKIHFSLCLCYSSTFSTHNDWVTELNWTECVCAVLCAKLPQLCPTLCDPMHRNPPGSSVHGVLQARILQWVAVPSSSGIANPGIKLECPPSPALADRFFTTSTG